MACLISFSRRVSLIHARRYCKMSQNSIFEKTNALFHAKECFACFKYREYSSATDVADGTLDSEATHEKVQNCIRESMHLLKEMTAQQNKRDFLFVSENEKFPTYRPIMSIRKSVLEMEVSLVLEIMKSLRVSDEPMLTMKIPRESILKLYYFEEKWTRILQRDDIPRVKQLMTLMEMADITQEEFCRAMSIFSIFPPANIEIRPLAEFTHEEIDAALLCHFRRDEGVDMLVKCVTHVIMKM